MGSSPVRSTSAILLLMDMSLLIFSIPPPEAVMEEANPTRIEHPFDVAINHRCCMTENNYYNKHYV